MKRFNWDDLVFEYRNKDYGAYLLRYKRRMLMFTKAFNRTTISLIFSSLISLFLCSVTLSAQERGDALSQNNPELNSDETIEAGRHSVATGVISIKSPYTFKVKQFVREKGISIKLFDRRDTGRYLKKDIDYSYNENTGIITLKEPLPEGCQSSDILVTGAFKKNIPAIKSGEYLREDYIAVIDKTHSPSIAFSQLKIQPSLITAYKGEYDIVLVHNFHEFDCGLNIMEDGKVGLSGSGGEDNSDISITVDGDNLILTGYGKHAPMHYIFVEDAKLFVAKKVLVGDYVDSGGNPYSFKDDGTASFGDIQFQYEIGLDYVERPIPDKDHKRRDYFQKKISRELYEYEIKDGVMSIYRTGGEMFEIVEPEPFVKLRRTGK